MRGMAKTLWIFSEKENFSILLQFFLDRCLGFSLRVFFPRVSRFLLVGFFERRGSFWVGGEKVLDSEG